MMRTMMMAALFLSACGGGGDDDPTSETTEPSETPTDSATESDTRSTDSGSTDTATTDPDPVPPEEGDLLIAEFYYSGAVPAGGTDHYFSDQFIELVNTTDHPLDLSGVMVGDVFGVAGPINPGTVPDSYRDSHPDEVVLSSLWRIPADTVLEAGGTFVVAHDGTNHRPFSTVDLSGAQAESYVRLSGGDDDHPTVPNLETVVFNGGYDWLITVFGPSVVVVAAGTELGTEEHPWGDMAVAPVDAVLDGVETLMDADSGDFKRLPDAIDAGFTFVSGTYAGESVHRRQEGGVYVDTNDSGADFEVGTPDPGRAPDTAGVTGDPALELGTGFLGFEPLDEGGDIELVAGIQGGWHLDVSTRFSGFGPSGVHLVYEALDTEADRVSFVTEAVLAAGSVLEEGEDYVRVGDRIVLDIGSEDEVVGETLIVRVTAALDGQTWSDERTVVVVDDD